MKIHIIDFLRFGLPLGSCLILCAFVETVISFYEACTDVISVFVVHWDTPVVEYIFETPTVLALNVVLFLQILADILFLWIGAILKGNRVLLISWIAVTILSVVVLNIVWVHYVYLDGEYGNALMSAIYTVILYSLFYAYIISVACQCLPYMKDNVEEIQPVGKGIECIWKFFSRNAASGAKLLIASELILNGYFFLSRKLPPVIFDRFYAGHENDNSPSIVLEELVNRGIRFIIGIVGLVIIAKGKQRWMKYWCIPYLITIFLSLAVFIQLVFVWVAEHYILTYGYLFFFSINICYRIIIFTMCFLYSQPQETGDFAFIAEYS